MSFDSVFHGPPTSNNGQAVPSGIASFGIDVTSGQEYFKAPTTSGWSATGYGRARTLITSAQLKTLIANPIQLVPAPGVGKMIVPVYGFLSYHFNSTAYTNTAGGDWCFQLGPVIAGNAAEAALSYFGGSSDLMDAHVDAFIANSLYAMTGLAAIAPALQRSLGENLPLFFTRNQHEVGTTELATGDGTLVVEVDYSIRVF